MTTTQTTWTGRVLDRLTGAVVYSTRPCETWEQAHGRAAKSRWAKLSGERYRIVVE